MRNRSLLSVVIVMVCLTAAPALAAAPQSASTWWNPFSWGSTAPKKKAAPVRKPAPKKAAANQPGVMQQIGTGTSNFFTGAKHTLMPWTKESKTPAKPAVKSSSSNGGGFWSQPTKSASSTKSGPKTTSDFLDLPRPEF